MTQEDAGVKLQNIKQFYMRGDIVNFYLVGNIIEPTKEDPRYPYVNPARLSSKTTALVLSFSEIFP